MKKRLNAVAAGVGAVALTVGLLVINQTSPMPTVTLLWDNPADMEPGTVTEVWGTTNLNPMTNAANWEGTNLWQLRTNLAGTNRVTLLRDKPAEFFKIRNRATNGRVSDWSRKTN